MTAQTRFPRFTVERAIKVALVIIVVVVIASAFGNIVFHFTELHW
jgi:hypothetical protein